MPAARRAWALAFCAVFAACSSASPAAVPSATTGAADATRPSATAAAPAATGLPWRRIATPAHGFEQSNAEWIEVDAPNGRKLRAVVVRPAGTDVVPVIVMLHTAGGFNAPGIRAIANDFTSAGFMVVAGCWFTGFYALAAPDATVTTACPEAPPYNGWNPGATQYADALVKVARVLPRADARRIGLIGGSAGASATLVLASTGAGIQAAVADSGEYTRFSSTAPAPIRYVEQLAAPLLIVHAMRDPDTPYHAALDYESALKRLGKTYETKYVDAAVHVVLQRSMPQYADVLATVVAFFKKHLLGAVVVTPSLAPSLAPVASKPALAVPAKGRLLYELPLDGRKEFSEAADTAAAGAADIAVGAGGAIEYRGRTLNAAKRLLLDPFLGQRFIGELDVTLSPQTLLRWDIRDSAGDRYELRLLPNELLVRHFNGPRETAPQPVPAQRITLTGPIVLAVVADETRYTIFIDQREVARFTDARVTPLHSAPVIGFGGQGTIRITGARFYEVP